MRKDQRTHESQAKFCTWCDAQATHRVYVLILGDLTKELLACWNCARECENEHGWTVEVLPIGNETEEEK